MKITREINLQEFEAWQGGATTLEKLIDLNRVQEIQELLEETFPDGSTETEVNDFLWFEYDYIMEYLGIEEEED